ncbi:MAG: T9SS type A sorting domain-containing protein [Flavobacteriales bacterium]
MKSFFPVLLTAFLSLRFVAMPGGVFAQNPGSLDHSFDPGWGTNDHVSTTAIQSDGKIVIGGNFTSYNGTPRNRIARLNDDGSLDATFDPGPGANDYVSTTAIQSDGRIVIVGNFTSYNGTPRNHITRLNADGSVDATFDPGVGTDGEYPPIYSTAIQSDGRIVIGGDFTSYNGTPRNRIARLNADGSLDATFDPGAGASSSVFMTTIQSDGRILIVGDFGYYNGTPRHQLARLNTDGSLDVTFDPGAGPDYIVTRAAIKSDGRIIIGGHFTAYNGTPMNSIAGLNVDGSLDVTFDPGAGANQRVSTIAIQSDGRIVIGGYFTSFNGTSRYRIARLNADGSLDATFDPGVGVVGVENCYVATSAIESDGKIIIGGRFSTYDGTPRNNIARLHGDGILGIGSMAPTGFSIFPNPASSSVTIVMPKQGRTDLVLRNALGQEVLRNTVGLGRNEVPLSGLAPGLYAAQVGAYAAQRLVVE